MATIKIILGIVCLTFFGRVIELSRYLLESYASRLAHYRSGFSGKNDYPQPSKLCGSVGGRYIINGQKHWPSTKANQIIMIAESQLGVREATGHNDGEQVALYLQYTNFPKDNPWCAAFVSWIYGQAGLKEPRTAWSPALFPKERLCAKVAPGLVYGLYDIKKKRIVHCGIALRKRSDWIIGIEGNTNIDGSAEGDGVYLKRRHALTIHAIADWISLKGGEHAN
jgi:hypothetical protein